jgi:hypothetical protein
MAIPMMAMMGAGALMGGMGGKQQAKGKTTTNKSQTTAWNEGAADDLFGNYTGAMNKSAGLNYGPTADQTRLYQNMMNQSMRGGGGGGGGGGFSSQYGGGGGGGGGGGNQNQKYAGVNVAQSEHEQKVLSDYYLDMENNPYIQQQLAAMQQEGQESFDRSSTAAMQPFLQAGGTMGFTGANLSNQARMVDDYNENMQNQQAGYLGQQYQFERGQQTAANQAWSGREQAYDVAGMGADAQRASARMAANASRYNADSQRYVGMAGIGAQNAAQAWNQKMGMFGVADQYANMQRQGQGLGQMGVYGQGMSQTLPWQQGFGENVQTQTTPGSSQLGGFLQGAIGGAMGGAGMGGKGGGGGGSPAVGPTPWGMGMPPGGPFSDIALKDNVVRLDAEYADGVPLATWTWKHNGEPGFGVIAQDLEKVMPERVGTVNGFKYVWLGG